MFNVVLFVVFVMVMREVRKKYGEIKVLIIVYCRLEIENYVN